MYHLSYSLFTDSRWKGTRSDRSFDSYKVKRDLCGTIGICFIVHPKVEKIFQLNRNKFQLNTTHYYFLLHKLSCLFRFSRAHRNFNDWNVFQLPHSFVLLIFVREKVQVKRCEKYVMECSFFFPPKGYSISDI